MRRSALLARAASVALLLLATSMPLRAQTSDSAAVLATVQRLFDAMASRDSVAARALLVPGARFVSLRGDTASNAVRIQSDTAFLRSLGAEGARRLLERIWTPRVQLHGPLATVWAPYDFHIDGTPSHCGVDTFTLVRLGGAWRISEITYTRERGGCSPSPLGPPR